VVVGTLAVSLLTEGVHSGDASGLVASSFRVIRALLDRLEDAQTGAILAAELAAPIPPHRVRQAERVAEVLGDEVWTTLPLQPGARPLGTDRTELILNRTWRPALAITGVEGLPALADAGNVMRPRTALRLSLRLPPTVDAARAEAHLASLLTRDPPYGAQVTWTGQGAAAGWDAPPLAGWLEQAIERGSQRHFGKPAALVGEGGSIPFIHTLAQRFPEAQFLITGVLGPGSNAHGPNEFLDLPTARKLTLVVAEVLAAHAGRAPA
jgi:acetylornithine deacetylase/succinyl-diaminopimelate desuccinylase-like protein